MTTPNFELPEWESDQNQPNVTVNTALRIIECLSQLTIIDRDLTTPPSTPSDGDCYIPAATATDDWEDHEDDIAMYIGTGWVFRTPRDGWAAWVQDEATEVRYSAGSSGGWS